MQTANRLCLLQVSDRLRFPPERDSEENGNEGLPPPRRRCAFGAHRARMGLAHGACTWGSHMALAHGARMGLAHGACMGLAWDSHGARMTCMGLASQFLRCCRAGKTHTRVHMDEQKRKEATSRATFAGPRQPPLIINSAPLTGGWLLGCDVRVGATHIPWLASYISPLHHSPLSSQPFLLTHMLTQSFYVQEAGV